MKIKNLAALLMLVAATFSFAACSNDDENNDTQQTYQVVLTNVENATSANTKEVTDAFDDAFGSSDGEGVYTLTGTKAECDRKAKELAMKASSDFDTFKSFSATVELCNVNSDETIYEYDVDNSGNNAPFQSGAFWVTTDKSSITLKSMKGKKVKIVSIKKATPVYEGTVDSDSYQKDVNRKTNGIFYKVTVESSKAFGVRLDK